MVGSGLGPKGASMFEGIKPFVNGTNAAAAQSARRDANDANMRADAIKHGAEGAILTLVAQRNQLQARIAQLEAENADLKSRAYQAEMVVAGRDAQLDAMEAAHTNSPLLADSGKRFKDGDVKSKLRLIFEAAFDAKAKAMNITNPVKWRED